MNHVCDEKVWDRVLSFNVSIFLNRVKRNLEEDLDIFLYLKFRFYLFVFSNPFLHSVFLHFYFSKKIHKIIRNQQNTTVNFVLGFIRNCLTVMLLFKILLLMTEILLLGLINFLKKLHFFLLIFALIMHFFIDAKKLRF